jgi:dsRNA-specific ribonuclease
MDASFLATEWAFHVTPWEPVFLGKVQSARRSIRIACPFVKLRNVRLILASLSRDSTGIIEIQVLTRLNVRDCSAFVHDLSALELLLDNPVKDRCRILVRINNTLHAKLYVFDDQETIVTSSNLTYAAFYKNLEIALASTRPDVVNATIRHFDAMFTAGIDLTEDAISTIRRQMKPSAFQVPEVEVPETTVSSDAVSEPLNANQSTPVYDEATIDSIDVAIGRRLEKKLCDGLFTLEKFEAGELSNGVMPTVENRFIEDVLPLFGTLFGDPLPTVGQLATMFVHSSAPGLSALKSPMTSQSDAVTIGKEAIQVAVAEQLVRNRTLKSTAESISDKIAYIMKSTHLIQQLSDRGLARLIVGKGFVALNSQGEAGRTAVTIAMRNMSYRIGAFLYSTRSWRDFSVLIQNLLDLESAFPYESYQHEEYKTLLQMECQARYGASPVYKLDGKEGPDHESVFTVSAWGGKSGSKQLGQGTGHTLKEAETNAAYSSLKNLPQFPLELSRTSSFMETPDWLRKRCETTGQSALLAISGQRLDARSVEAVLIPPGKTGTPLESQRLRDAFSVVGSQVRQILALEFANKNAPSDVDLRQYLNNINKSERVVAAIRRTPLGKWISELAKERLFRESDQLRPANDTVNAAFGAVFMAYGLEKCVSLATLLFRDTSSIEESVPARSKLQQIIQSLWRQPTESVLTKKSRPLHKPSEAHNSRFEVVWECMGERLGMGIGSNMKAAIEAASRAVLDNPRFIELVNAKRQESPSNSVPIASDHDKQ